MPGLQFRADRIGNPILNGLFGIHPVVTVEIFHDLIVFLAAVFSQYFGSDLFDSFGLFCLDFKVHTHTLDVTPKAGLVDHHLAMWINKSPALSTATQQYRSHRSSKSDTNS